MQDLVRTLFAVTAGDAVTAQLADGTRISGVPSRIERDQAGVRVELCPPAGNDPQYRLTATRTQDGWRPPTVDRKPFLGEWTHHGDLVALDCDDATDA